MRSHLLAVGLATMLLAGGARAQTVQQRIGYPRDWSHGKVLFTNGGSAMSRAATQRDPHVLHDWLYRNSFRTNFRGKQLLREIDPDFADIRSRIADGINARKQASKVDWAVSLGTNAGMAIGETPAKYVFDAFAPVTLASCTNDFVVYTMEAAPGVGSQANIVAFNNLYTGPVNSYCPFGAQTPRTTNYAAATFMWSYAVGSAGSVLSPVLSMDGKKVAFIENSNPAVFHVLTWVAGQGTNATTGAVAPGTGGSSVSSVSYTNTSVAGCTANSSDNSASSPYVDYNADAAYMGADNGVLYRIKNVFNGTPTLDYCVIVSAGNRLTSPVYDPVTNKVFISNGQNLYAYTVGATSFTAAGSIQVGFATSAVILSPIVDSTNGFVYTFANRGVNNTNNAVVTQTPVSLASRVEARIGTRTTEFIMSGAFDDKYFSTGPSAGTLYVCGTQSSSASKPGLYAVSFQSSGVMNTATVLTDNHNINGAGNPNGTCSPLMAFSDGTNDRLFVGTGASGATTGANLVTMWSINNRITSATAVPSATAINEIGGTTGFSIDNVATVSEASSIYFGTLSRSAVAPCGNNYCAVKLTRSALQ
jgi:hypothetical protein